MIEVKTHTNNYFKIISNYFKVISYYYKSTKIDYFKTTNSHLKVISDHIKMISVHQVSPIKIILPWNRDIWEFMLLVYFEVQ